jgi:hypothetical protein
MYPGSVTAADQQADDDPLTVDYLDPFDLTVRQMVVSQNIGSVTDTTSVSSSVASVTTTPAPSAVQPLIVSGPTTSAYAQPLKVWIPYRPTFRSPCTPHY